jgi:hypothetical protein
VKLGFHVLHRRTARKELIMVPLDLQNPDTDDEHEVEAASIEGDNTPSILLCV